MDEFDAPPANTPADEPVQVVVPDPNEITLDHEEDAVVAQPLSFTAASEKGV